MKVVYNESTRTFGIHASRVRDSVADRYKSKYGESSDKYNDYIECKDLLDKLEFDSDEVNRPYGYSTSPKRITDYYGRDLSGRLIPRRDYRSKNNPERKKSSDLDPKVIDNEVAELNDEFYKRLARNIHARGIGDEIAKSSSISPDRVITDKVKDLLISKGGEFTEGSGSSKGVVLNSGAYKMNINTNDPDTASLHELQHLMNISEDQNPKDYDYYYSKFKPDFKFETFEPIKTSIQSPDDILGYANSVLQEEMSANRGGVMNGYLLGNDSDSYNGKDYNLEIAQLDGDFNQNTYNAAIGGYQPPSNRYNMSNKVYEKFKHNLEYK